MELVDMQGLKPCPLRVLVQVQAQVITQVIFVLYFMFYNSVLNLPNKLQELIDNSNLCIVNDSSELFNTYVFTSS
jgi:hypothetical protein